MNPTPLDTFRSELIKSNVEIEISLRSNDPGLATFFKNHLGGTFADTEGKHLHVTLKGSVAAAVIATAYGITDFYRLKHRPLFSP